MWGKVGPLNPALRGGHTAHGERAASMAPCLCPMIERQGAQNWGPEADKWEGVWTRGRGKSG